MPSQRKGEPVETELKLRFPAQARAQIEQHPMLRELCASPPEEQHLVSTYYDTPDLALAGASLILRVRRNDGQRVQTVKCSSGEHHVAARRGEWEWPIGKDEPEFGLLAATPVGSDLDPAIAGRLEPVIVADIRRNVRMLRLKDGSSIEAAIDEGQIRCGDVEEAVHELELELKQGTVGALYRLALELHAQLPLQISTEPKAARGFRLRTGRPPGVEKAHDPDLDRHVRVAGGFRQIVAAALGGLLANQPAAAAGDAEGVHQTRVAIRRLRAALVLFQPHLELHATARFESELQRLGQILGGARDWDVFCLETLPGSLTPASASDSSKDSWRHLLAQAAEAERAAAHRRLQQELAGPALTSLSLGLAAWVEEDPELLGDRAMQGRLSQVAPELLGRVERKVAKRGRHIGRRSGEELHGLRKSLKKLRYSADYLAGLYDPKAVKTYLKKCKALQQRLGDINDAAVAVTLAEKLGEAGRTDLAGGVGALAQWADKRRHEALDGLPDAWNAFRNASPFWR